MGELAGWSRKYTAQKAFFSFMGAAFRIYNPDGTLAFYIKQKAFRLKEEINIFADENQTDKKLSINARSWSDFRGTYDITDVGGEKVGAARRAGVMSLFRDEWTLLDNNDAEMGKILEIGGIMIFIRKWFKIIPQKYEVSVGGKLAMKITQQFNPFRLGYDVEIVDADFDPRLGVGLTVLLLAIEGGRDGG